MIDKWAELVEELGATYPWVQVQNTRLLIRNHFSTADILSPGLGICEIVTDGISTLFF